MARRLMAVRRCSYQEKVLIRMRKAAGIILMVVGVVGVIGVVGSLTSTMIYVELLRYHVVILGRIASAAILIAGGVFCLRRTYWGACLATAAVAVFIGVVSTIDYVKVIVIGRPLFRVPSLYWGIWILLVVGVIAAVFIGLRKKEWQELSDSVDGRVSYGG